MSKELIVSVNGREKKIAIVENDQVTEFYIERGEENEGIVGNIYKGRVMRVLPGMQSAFVDIGLERDAFLYVSDFFDEEEEFERIVVEKSKKGDLAAAERAAAERIEQARLEREQRMEAAQEKVEILLEEPEENDDDAEEFFASAPAPMEELYAAEEEELVTVTTPAAEPVSPPASAEAGSSRRDRERERRRRRDQRRRGGNDSQPTAEASEATPTVAETHEPPVTLSDTPETQAEAAENSGNIAELQEPPQLIASETESSFERVVDEEEAADADNGDLLKDAILQERLADEVRAVEFDLEPNAEVPAAVAFERVADDDDPAPVKDAPAWEVVTATPRTSADELEESPNQPAPSAATFERISDDEEIIAPAPPEPVAVAEIPAELPLFVEEISAELPAPTDAEAEAVRPDIAPAPVLEEPALPALPELASDETSLPGVTATEVAPPPAPRGHKKKVHRRTTTKKEPAAPVAEPLAEVTAAPEIETSDVVVEATETATPAKKKRSKTTKSKAQPAPEPVSAETAETTETLATVADENQPAADAPVNGKKARSRKKKKSSATGAEALPDGTAKITASDDVSEFATRRGGRRRRRKSSDDENGENGENNDYENDAEDVAEPEPEPEPVVMAERQEIRAADTRRDNRPSRDNRNSTGRDNRPASRDNRDSRSNGRTTSGSGSGRRDRGDRPPTITDLLREGQEILVQIAKEPIAKKGARITSHIALPGRYLVYMPTVEHVGVSRKIDSDQERARLRKLITAIRNEENVPSGGFIVRTAGVGISDEDLRADARYLVRTWLDIRHNAERAKAPALVHQDLDLVQRLLRDQLSDDFAAIRVDAEEEYLAIIEFINRIQPRLVNRVKLYTRDTPILEYYGVQEEVDKAIKPRVWLRSGGYLVINQTEALVAIDVNTGKFVGRNNGRLEDTITRTNLEAVEEIARQIRLRDLGGIIVMDLIDMDDRRNRQRVLQALHDAMASDKSPNKVLTFNDFGLVIMTRKRVKQSLERTLCAPCHYCQGAGLIKSPQTVCYEILTEARQLAKGMAGERITQTTLRVHPEIARALRSTEKDVLQEVEDYLSVVDLTSDQNMHQEQFDFAFV